MRKDLFGRVALGEPHWTSIVYGVEKCGADRMIRDMAAATGPGNVTFLSIWPGFGRTERNTQPGYKDEDEDGTIPDTLETLRPGVWKSLTQ